MPRNGSGTFTREHVSQSGATMWQLDEAASVGIEADLHDDHDQDIADALTASIAKDGQTPITADLPMSGFKHTNVAAATARTEYARMSQVQDSTALWGGTSGGSANAYTITLTPAITAYAAGQHYIFVSNFANTASATLNINATGAKTIKLKDGSTNLASGDIASGDVVEVVYDGTNMRLVTPERNLAVAAGGTGAVTAAGARTNLGAAASGSNGDITALTNCASITDNANITIGTSSSNDVIFNTNGTARWYFEAATGHLIPNADNTYDIGKVANQVKDIHFQGSLKPATTQTISFFSFTTRHSLDPGAATAATCADAINTIWTDLKTLGLFS